MDIIIGLIANIAVLVVLIGTLTWWARKREKKMTPEAFTIRKPMFPAYTGAIVIVFFGFLLFAILIGPDRDLTDPVLLVLLAFLLAGIWMVVDSVTWRVRVDENGLFYHALFRKDAAASFGDLNCAIQEKMKISVYTKDAKLFSAAITYTGYNTLIERLKKERITIKNL